MNDDELLRRAMEAVLLDDPPPASLRDAAVRALTWDTELGLMHLEFDSALAGSDMRSRTQVRDLTFVVGDRHSSATIDLTFQATDDGVEIFGLIEPADAQLQVVTGLDRIDVVVASEGRFEVVLNESSGSFVITVDGRSWRTPLVVFDEADGEPLHDGDRGD